MEPKSQILKLFSELSNQDKIETLQHCLEQFSDCEHDYHFSESFGEFDLYFCRNCRKGMVINL